MAANDNGIPAVADVVVVGSGSAGAVVARRLVDAGVSVVVVEAGGPDDNPAIHEPARLFELWDSEQDWGYRTVPQAACAGRELHWPRGKVLGGSSALNGMIYARGSPQRLRHLGVSRQRRLGLRGRAAAVQALGGLRPGRVRLSRIGRAAARAVALRAAPGQRRRVAAAQEAGIPFNDDHNGERARRRLVLPAHDQGRPAPDAARRHSSRRSPGLAGLTVLTRALRRRLLFEGARCVGVEIARDGCGRADPRRARGRRLRRDGRVAQAPAALRHRARRRARPPRDRVVADLPGVGRNLHDHVLSPVIYAASRAVPPPLPGLQQLHSHLFWRSRSGLPGPTSSRSSSTCRCTSRGWRGRPTATR